MTLHAHDASRIAQWLDRTTGILEGHEFDSRCPWAQKILLPRISTCERLSVIFTLSKSQSIYHSVIYCIVHMLNLLEIYYLPTL